MKLGVLIFSIGVVLAISFGAKVPEKDVADFAESLKQRAAAEALRKKAEVAGIESDPHPTSDEQARAAADQKVADDFKASDDASQTKEMKAIDHPNWGFIFGVLLAQGGLFTWWQAVRAQRAAATSGADAETDDDPVLLMSQVSEELESIDENELDGNGLCELSERLLADYVTPMMESRQKLIESLGMSVGAEVLVIAAAGERLLNRTWTAAADGHLPEAIASFANARQAFAEANQAAANQSTTDT